MSSTYETMEVRGKRALSSHPSSQPPSRCSSGTVTTREVTASTTTTRTVSKLSAGSTTIRQHLSGTGSPSIIHYLGEECCFPPRQVSMTPRWCSDEINKPLRWALLHTDRETSTQQGKQDREPRLPMVRSRLLPPLMLCAVPCTGILLRLRVVCVSGRGWACATARRVLCTSSA